MAACRSSLKRSASSSPVRLRNQLFPLVEMQVVEMLDEQHRREVADSPESTYNRRRSCLEEPGWQPEVLIRRLENVGETGLTRRQSDQSRGIQVEVADDLRESQWLPVGQNEARLHRVLPPVEAVAGKMKVGSNRSLDSLSGRLAPGKHG